LLPKFATATSDHDEESLTNIGVVPSKKRESPTNDEEDMDVPLKLLRRNVNIEKL